MLRSKKGITSETKRFLFSFLRVHPAWEVAFGGAPCKAFQFRGDCAHHRNDHRAYYVGQMQTPLKPFTVFLQHDDRKEIRVYPFNVYQIIRGADFTPSDDRWHDLSAQAVREVARDIAQYGYLDGRDKFFERGNDQPPQCVGCTMPLRDAMVTRSEQPAPRFRSVVCFCCGPRRTLWPI